MRRVKTDDIFNMILEISNNLYYRLGFKIIKNVIIIIIWAWFDHSLVDNSSDVLFDLFPHVALLDVGADEFFDDLILFL